MEGGWWSHESASEIGIADPLAVGQRVTLEIMNGGFGEPWLHATGTLLRMEDTETG